MTLTYVGIDLGTTNSAISSFDGDSLRLHKSPEQNDVTPSVIFFDGRGHRFVGQRAYMNAPLSPDSAAMLFKRLMGTSTPVLIPSAGLSLTPEQCSAEVLRVLFGYLPEETRQAGVAGTIITVPAAFNQMQKESTLLAAEEASLGNVLLLQEPVAAVMSVMRSTQHDGRFLIYDLGGGTLDIALAESIGGRVTLLAHGGIAMCGGRDFDRLIVQRIIEPWLHDHFALPHDALERPQYRALSRLATRAAELAKIDLSAREEAVISLSDVELRMRDEASEEMYLDIPFSRNELTALIRAELDDSVQAAFDALHQAGLAPADVERLVFVGGPTQYKPLRDYVSDKLGIAASNEINPMTAVAEGAALFAESVDWSTPTRGRKSTRSSLAPGSALPVSFSYMARTPSPRAKCAVKLSGTLAQGHEFQLDSLDSGWSSGRIGLEDGVVVDLPLAKQGANVYRVFLFEPSGNPVPLADDHITIIRTTATVDAIPASHSVGVEVLEKLGGNSALAHLVRAGESLPKKGSLTFRAAESLKSGSGASLNFKLWEGEIGTPVSDNRYIGAVKIAGSDLEEGVIPAGAELVCDYEVIESGNVAVTITVPSIGATFHSGHNFYSPQEGQVDFSQAAEQVRTEAGEVRERVDHISATIESEDLTKAQARLDSAAALTDSNDPETAKQAMDNVLEAKRLLAKVRKDHLQEIRQLELASVSDFFDTTIRPLARASEIASYENLVLTATRVQSRETGEFENYLSEIRSINSTVLWRQDWFLVDRFNDLAASPHSSLMP